MDDSKKRLVFISHATPEDNEFALWLSTKLKLMGYEVWSDVTQLFGGEKWWEDIEQAVYEYTSKFVIVITKTSLSKPGVRREVEMALKAEKINGIKNFIIPIIIDDSEFSGQPYDFSERNIVSFSNGWSFGLANLRERLIRDGVVQGDVPTNLGEYLAALIKPKLKVISADDLVVSNRLRLNSYPGKLNFYRVPIEANKWSAAFSGLDYPWFEWGGMACSFASKDDFQSCMPSYVRISSAPGLCVSSVLDDAPRNHAAFLRGEVIKKINYLIADAWGRHMRTLGLHKYELSGGRVAWFFPDSKEFGGLNLYADVFGEQKKKQVIGYSTKNGVFWHYAVEARPHFGRYPSVSLVPHVVFTSDGSNALNDKKKMHRLRRGFCSNWWNDRWRGLLLAYLNMISMGGGKIDIPISGEDKISFNSRPEFIKSGSSVIDSSDEQGFLIGLEEDFEDVLVVED